MSEDKVKQKIFDAYRDHWLEEGKDPTTIYKFCKQLKLREKDFYDHFSSFKAIRTHFWVHFFSEVKEELEKTETYQEYSAREKWLSFYFTFFEKLTEQRSFAISLWPSKMSPQVFKHFKSMKSHFLELSNTWLQQAEEENAIGQTEMFSDLREEFVWWHFLFLIHFWVKDDSKGFERTDAAIEKSVHLLFEIFGNELAESVVDFAKFLAPDAPNPFDFWSKLKSKF